MYKKYKNDISNLKKMLLSLETDPSNLKILLELQFNLINLIKRIEKWIRNLKSKGFDTIEAYKNLTIFKYFGDSVAFLYIDKHNLKQLSYDLHSDNLKKTSGFLSDKEGLNFEVEELKNYLEAGIPCLLTDLTNNIRYGDILILVGGDPIIIECKKNNKNLNSRSRRQKQRLDELKSFYQNDKKTMYKDTVEVSRRFMQPVSNYIDDINYLIGCDDTVSKEVERGLYYFIFKENGAVEEEFSKYDLEVPFIFHLNYLKYEGWFSFTPYILSIKNIDALIDFIYGDLNIIIAFDTKVIGEIVKKNNIKFELMDQEDYPFLLTKYAENSNDVIGQLKISMHLLYRIPFEFLSLKELVINSCETYFSENEHVR